MHMQIFYINLYWNLLFICMYILKFVYRSTLYIIFINILLLYSSFYNLLDLEFLKKNAKYKFFYVKIE